MYTIVVNIDGHFAVVTSRDGEKPRRIVPVRSLDLPEPANHALVEQTA